jgi:hypothetical protein
MRRDDKAYGIVRSALLVGLIAPLIVLIGAAGAKFGFMDWKAAFGLVARPLKPTPLPPAALAAVVGVVVGLIALWVARRDFRHLGLMALVAFLFPALTLGGFWKFKQQASSVPPIHDVSTNWEDPVMFSRQLMAARAGALNPVEADPRVPDKAGPPWAGRRVAEINAQTCPEAKPIMRQLDPDAVAAVLEHNGLQISGRAPFRVEGTFESFWWGFKDDVAVRIRPERTDVRSVSRVGMSDLGANCARVTKIIKQLSR